MLVQIGVASLGNRRVAPAMDDQNVASGPRKLPDILSLVRSVIVCKQDPPVATWCHLVQVRFEEFNDILLSVTALGRSCYRHPAREFAIADELL